LASARLERQTCLRLPSGMYSTMKYLCFFPNLQLRGLTNDGVHAFFCDRYRELFGFHGSVTARTFTV
jgi:hypothetical protein